MNGSISSFELRVIEYSSLEFSSLGLLKFQPQARELKLLYLINPHSELLIEQFKYYRGIFASQFYWLKRKG